MEDELRRLRLTEVGEALHGRDWQTPIAAELGVTPRLVRMWLHGDRRIPDRVMLALPDLVQQGMDRMQAEMDQLAEMQRSMRPG